MGTEQIEILEELYNQMKIEEMIANEEESFYMEQLLLDRTIL